MYPIMYFNSFHLFRLTQSNNILSISSTKYKIYRFHRDLEIKTVLICQSRLSGNSTWVNTFPPNRLEI